MLDQRRRSVSTPQNLHELRRLDEDVLESVLPPPRPHQPDVEPLPEHVLHHVLQGRELLFGNPVDAVHGARIDCDLDALLVREPLAKDSCSPRAFHPEDRRVAPEAPLAPVVERETGETVSKKEEHGA